MENIQDALHLKTVWEKSGMTDQLALRTREDTAAKSGAITAIANEAAWAVSAAFPVPRMPKNLIDSIRAALSKSCTCAIGGSSPHGACAAKMSDLLSAHFFLPKPARSTSPRSKRASAFAFGKETPAYVMLISALTVSPITSSVIRARRGASNTTEIKTSTPNTVMMAAIHSPPSTR